MTRPTNRKLRAGFHMEPAAVILEAVGVTENMDVARQVKWVGSPFHSAAKWRFLKFRRSEHDSMLPSPGEVKAAPTRPLGRRYAASRPRNDAVQSPFGGGRTRVRGRGGADRVEYDATVYPQELSDAASVWFLRRRNAPARLRYTPRPKPIRVAWRLRPHWRNWSMTDDGCAVLR